MRIRKRVVPLVGATLVFGSGFLAQWQEHHYVTMRMVSYPPLASEAKFKVAMPWECSRCGLFEINCKIRCKQEMADKKAAYSVLNEKYVKQQYQ